VDGGIGSVDSGIAEPWTLGSPRVDTRVGARERGHGITGETVT
jgi:hypothetical protein